MPRSLLMYVVAVTCFAVNLHAAEYFVSPSGSDTNPGSQARPFATIQKASQLLRPGDTCYIRKGTYREVLRPARSGRDGAPITYASWNNEKVLLSGADRVTGWRKEEGGIYSAPMSWSLAEDNQVFADGQMLCEACWPDLGEDHLFKPTRAMASGGSPTTLICDQIPSRSDDWKGARLWCAGGAAWICWTSTVTGYDPDSHVLTFKESRDTWYTPRKGNLFVLKGLPTLHAPGQWFYDGAKKRLLIIPPEGTDLFRLDIESKRRTDAIDLSGRSDIHIKGIAFRAAGIRADSESSDIVLENLHGRFVSHSNSKDVSGSAGILLNGRNILMLNCDVGYSSSSVVSVSGCDHRIINCHIHHGGYGGLWRGTVSLSGRRILFSHNTVRHAGRDLINTHGLMESCLQYNDVSDAGWLTKDLGMFYGHNTDFANTVFRYNLVHDNHAAHCAMGIYFDHLSHNAIVHNNVVWNVGMDPIRFNNPSYCNLVYNNTCSNTGNVGTFDHSKREDLYASRYFNNIFNRPIKLPDHVAVYSNVMIDRPDFRDPANHDYRLKRSSNDINVGAHSPGDQLWKAGCDLRSPPEPLPVYQPPRIAWMNRVRNACFELGSTESWQTVGSSKVRIVKGNGWGNKVVGSTRSHATGTSKYECQLGPGESTIEQVVSGLHPDRRHTLSAWLRVSDGNERITLGVRQGGSSDLTASTSSTEWTRKAIEFITSPSAKEVTIFIQKQGGDGKAWLDNITLPLTP